MAVQQHPDDWDVHVALAFAATGLGLKDEAIREGRRATELLPVSRDAFAGPEFAVPGALPAVQCGQARLERDVHDPPE